MPCHEENEADHVVQEEPVEPKATNGEDFPWNDIRLPKFIKPLRYDIELSPDLDSRWVKGQIILKVAVSSFVD